MSEELGKGYRGIYLDRQVLTVMEFVAQLLERATTPLLFSPAAVPQLSENILLIVTLTPMIIQYRK